MTIIKLFLLIILIVAIYTTIRTQLLVRKSLVLLNSTQKFERILPDAKQTIMVMGDSTAYGTGATNPAESVAGRLGTAYPQSTIINHGKNGQKIHELSINFLSNFATNTASSGEKYSRSTNPSHVNILVIQIGANDIIRFTSPDSLRIDLLQLLNNAKIKADKVVILHSGNIGTAPFFPRYLGWIWTMRTRQIRELYIREIASVNNGIDARGATITYIDLFQNSDDDIYATDPKKYYAADGLHLTGEGYKIWFERIQAAIQ